MPTDFSETWRCRVVTHLRERQQKLRPNFRPSCLPQPALPRIDRFRTSPYFLFARKPCRWVGDPGWAGAIAQKNVSGQSHPRRTLGDYKLMGILAPTQRACHIPATRPHRWKQPSGQRTTGARCHWDRASGAKSDIPLRLPIQSQIGLPVASLVAAEFRFQVSTYFGGWLREREPCRYLGHDLAWRRDVLFPFVSKTWDRHSLCD